MFRIDYEKLEPSDDYLVMYYEGKPFNGVAFENNQNDILITETNFVNGQKSGMSKECSSTGILIREQWFVFDALHGISREWYGNGVLKRNGFFELGVCIREQECDTRGNMTKDYTIDETGPQFSILQKLRNSNLGQLIN